MGERTGGAKEGEHIGAGMLDHVDDGKTTVAEALVYNAGGLRKRGREDQRDAYRDTD